MNDLLLALVVIGAVILFGALISVGNERQRRSIEALHHSYKQWAVQDLRLKRGTISSQIQIHDVSAWLTRVVSLAFGYQIVISDYQVHNHPVPSVEFSDGSTGNTVVCTLYSPDTLNTLLRKKASVLRGDLEANPLYRASRKTHAIELSMLNAGSTFDLELPVAWSASTADMTESDTLWAYIIT